MENDDEDLEPFVRVGDILTPSRMLLTPANSGQFEKNERVGSHRLHIFPSLRTSFFENKFRAFACALSRCLVFSLVLSRFSRVHLPIYIIVLDLVS